ncbi:ecto-NOX disulfide-thiol exchanger 2 isoform X2 [Manduca sexta]|nr:ecto-NOX disulfide-thiol exchanger 2 isoform X2 [Manduca sexta]KAG6442236.1 hypothetical protein O3G_MSEX002180 [Manduca sexta]KAG6442237.1 hypothetical protein O3G_MSEX002180 [Manduca sexta]
MNNSDVASSNINPLIMSNMYTQGNMMMAGGLYPNMIMPGAIIGSGMMAPTGMEIISGTSMELVQQSPIDMAAIAGQQMTATSMAPSSTPAMDMSMMGGMMMDPTMMAIYPGISTEMAVQRNKEIVLKHCKLIPPDSGTPQPPRRVKPPGCRTIFVGGFPDKVRESTVKEIFENYGRIHTLRLSKKNFCHIRFERENSVDAAMAISGYRIKLTTKEKDDMESEDNSNATAGWLHVDYALSRDDQNEYERHQRQLIRAQQAQIEQLSAQQEIASRSMSYDRLRRSPSPVRIQPFSNVAMLQLGEKIKNEEHFSSSVPTLLAWLERGECSKKNSNQFYSMIQATNTHIRRLYNEKMQAEEELQESKERVKKQIEYVIEQLEQVAKVFNAATHQRVWDHFTKPQRKNIETWQKMTQEFNSLKEEFNDKFYNDDSESNSVHNKHVDYNMEELQELRRENESLQFQLEAYKNEVDVIKADARKELDKLKIQLAAQQALQLALEKKNPPLPLPIEKPPPPPPLPDDLDAKVTLKEIVEPGCGEAKLIGIMSPFLQVHPHGASLDYVVSYVKAILPNVTQSTIHHVLEKHNDVFRRTTSGMGANMEHKWTFIAFNNNDISQPR